PEGRPDRSMVIGFDRSARVLSPMGDPARTTFSGVGASGGTSVAGGIRAALKELAAAEPATPKVEPSRPADAQPDTPDTAEAARGRRGIVVFSDGLDTDLDAQLASVAAARAANVRVTLGLLSPPASTSKASAARAAGDDGGRGTASLAGKEAVPAELVEAILDTGGLVATLDSTAALDSFADLVVARGAASLTDPGSDIGGPVGPGLTVYTRATDGDDPTQFHTRAAKGQRVEVTVRALSGNPVRAALSDVQQLKTFGDRRVEGTAKLTATLAGAGEVELEISAAGSGPAVYALTVAASG
ncbi:MAG TPA: hypothetical protein VFT95_04045, partial [Micromonosporaceae bacterium]|nr:hypothetical protein [Micromonosporaceae bacterium]